MNVTDEQKALEEALQQIEDTLEEVSSSVSSQSFLSGKAEPNLSDLAVYGALRSIEGLPAHTRILGDHVTRPVKDWYERTKQKVDA